MTIVKIGQCFKLIRRVGNVTLTYRGKILGIHRRFLELDEVVEGEHFYSWATIIDMQRLSEKELEEYKKPTIKNAIKADKEIIKRIDNHARTGGL